MTQQPEALRMLIEDLELNHEFCPTEVILQAAAELRRLYAENARMASELARPMSSEATLVLHDNTRLRAEIDYEEQRFATLSDDYAKLANCNAQLLAALENSSPTVFVDPSKAHLRGAAIAAAKETQ